VKLGDFTALETFRRRGAFSTGRRGGRSGLSPAPRKEPSAGATDAGDTLHLVNM
jgi:hypothetical protein